MNKRCILWFRNDLRLHDNEALYLAIQNFDHIIPVYFFDPRKFGESRYGILKTGAIRAQFVRESVQCLRKNIRNVGGELLVRLERPENGLQVLAEKYGADAILAHREAAPDEISVEQKLQDQLNIPLKLFWGATLFHIDDLPFKPDDMPSVFSQFRKPLEKKSAVRPLFPAPGQISTAEFDHPGAIVSLEELNIQPQKIDDRAVLDFKGGEHAALERLDAYFWKRDQLQKYKYTRNGLLGADYSSKFSPWLAVGALSPRKIHAEVKKYEEERKKNISTYWMIFELIWRDFFRFSTLAAESKLFRPGGVRGINQEWREDETLFERWKQGQTGIPFVDANMRELNATGYMSNRGRQNVASFLSQNLNIDWRLGAAYFEQKLIDYDVCSNWFNWAHNSRAGLDPRNRYFNVVNQAKKYDKDGEYVKTWLPELKNLPADQVHEPWVLNQDTLALCGVELGMDYPEPIIDLEASYERIRRERKNDL